MDNAFQIVWFKRDLRIQDHEAILEASRQTLPVVFVYLHEPELFQSTHYSPRHERFVWESIIELKAFFQAKKLPFFAIEMEAIPLFESLIAMGLQKVWSLQEIGLEKTYLRDRLLAALFKKQAVDWKEIPYSGIRRGLKSRKNFNEYWYDYMSNVIPEIQWESFQVPPVGLCNVLETFPIMKEKPKVPGIVQEGGAQKGWQYLRSFTDSRVSHYMQHISKPEESRRSCSRISPYLAWGNLSLRQVFQLQYIQGQKSAHKRNMRQFASRLRWREHFMQKF